MKKDEVGQVISNLDKQTSILNCLYAVDELFSDPNADEQKIFENLLTVIPTGWRFPEICRVSITYHGTVYKAADFKSTELKLISRIVVDKETVGEIVVAYIKPLRIENGIFLPDELALINTIAGKISNFLLLKKLRNAISAIKNNETHTEANHTNDIGQLQEWLKKMELTDEEITAFSKVKIEFRKGETMCKQGSMISYIMILANGLSKNYLEGFQESGYNFSIVKPFDFIGLSSLYGSAAYHFSGSALTPCTVFIVENSLFKNTIHNNPRFANHVLRWYCNTTERHLKRLSCIANKQALGRIADILLYLKNDIFESRTIKSIISRRDIAELAAMSTESAVRILSDLKKSDIINISGNDIEILNEKRLETFSHSG